MSLAKIVRNIRTAVANPRLAAYWLGWHTGVRTDRRLADGTPCGGFTTFTDFWSFRPPSAAEVRLIERAMPADGLAIDVGANVGAFAVTLGRLRPGGRVLAFEPVPHTYAALAANVSRAGLANVTARNQAVGREVGTVFMSAATTGSAINHVVAAGQGVEVACVTLDDVLTEVGRRKIDFLKVDVEGYEVAVLDGLAGALAAGRVGVMLIEVIPELLARQGASTEAVLDRLSGYGYRLRRLGLDGRAAGAVSLADIGGSTDWNFVAERDG